MTIDFHREDVCLVDCATTHTILKSKVYFSSLAMRESNVRTISGTAKMIEGSGRANILLPRGTQLSIENALYSSRAHRNLLSFKDIRRNGYHIETLNEENVEYLCITRVISRRKCTLEKLLAFSSGLYCTSISLTEINVTVNQKFTDFSIWHDRLGHPGSIMMRNIITNSCGHPLKSQQILQSNKFTCSACSKGKLIIRPSPVKIGDESLIFLERIQGDICGPIHPPCGPFRYFLILIDARSEERRV